MDELFKNQIRQRMIWYTAFLREDDTMFEETPDDIYDSFYDKEPAKSYLGHVKMERCPTCHNQHWHKEGTAICEPCQEKIKNKKMNEIVQRKLSMFEKFCIVHHISQGVKAC